MGASTEEHLQENRERWLRRMKKEDPRHARLYCPTCIRYLGAAQKCEDCDGQGQSQEEVPADRA